MFGAFGNIVRRLEAFLRIEPDLGASVVARSRIIYGTGFMVSTVHALNLISMLWTWGGWTPQHWLGLSVMVFGLLFILAVRWTKSPLVFGLSYGALSLLGVAINATVTTVPGAPPLGINAPTVPTLCASVALVAFLGSFRFSILYVIASMALMGVLHQISATYLTGFEAALAWQKTVQSWMGILIAGPVSIIIARMVFKNLDDMEETVNRARGAEQARSNFMAKMSHEIRTPLHGIIGLSDMLSRADLPASEGRQAELISTSAQNLMEIVDEILDMAKLEDGAVTISAKPFSPHTLLRDISDLFAAKASGKSIWIGADTDEAIPEKLIGDAQHLRQVLSNLVGNAVKFTQQGGVRLGARLAYLETDTAHVQFYVQDTGVGIPEEDQEQVFERFKQSKSANSSQTKGTGLGLSICQELTEKMGGRLELQSELEKGTVFYFTLALPIASNSEPESIAA